MKRSALLLLGILAAMPSRAAAQALDTSTLVGVVADASRAPIRGAPVRLSSPQLVGGPRSAVTDAAGSYRFTALPPGRYAVTVRADGFAEQSQTDIALEIAATLTVDFELAVAAVRDTVTVIARAPLVDVRRSASPTNFDRFVLENLPTSRRLEDLVALVPGVVANVAFGASQGSNGLVLDGVDLTDPEEGSPWLRLNFNWVEQVQTVTLGANVEHGGFTGAMTTGTLKSGSNRVSGLGEYWTTKTAWVGNNTRELSEQLQQQFVPRTIEALRDASFQQGGPIRKDRLWFFAGLEYYKREDRPAGFAGPGLTTQDDTHGIVKVTAKLAPSLRLEGFFIGGKNYLTGLGAGANTPMEATQISSQPERVWSTRLTWMVSDRTLVEVRNRGYNSPLSLDSSLPNGNDGPAPHIDVDTLFASVNAMDFGRYDRRPRSIAATASHFANRVLGLSHELKFGFELEHGTSTSVTGYPGGKFYQDIDGQPYQVLIWGGWKGTFTTTRSSIYAQDRWRLSERLTIDPGIRWDINRGSTPSVSNAFSTSPLAFRVGVAWDLGPDHRTVARAHAGRYYDTLYGSQFQLVGVDNAPQITARVTGPDQFTEIDRSPFKSAQTVDPRLSQSYMDECLVGIEHELFKNVSVTGQIIRRNYRDMVGSLDMGAAYAPVQRVDPGPDGTVGTADDGGSVTVFDRTRAAQTAITTNLPGAFRNYTAFQLVGRKRFADKWQMLAAYTWSRTEGSFNNTFHSNARIGGGYADPNTQINNAARTSYDTPHEVKVEGMYRIPQLGGFNLSAVYRYNSGYAWGRTIRVFDLTQGLEFVRVEPRGTRRLPAVNVLDLRVEKTFGLPKSTARLGLFVDVFNVANQGAPNPTAFRPVYEFSGPRFGRPDSWLDPRTARGAIRVTF